MDNIKHCPFIVGAILYKETGAVHWLCGALYPIADEAPALATHSSDDNTARVSCFASQCPDCRRFRIGCALKHGKMTKEADRYILVFSEDRK